MSQASFLVVGADALIGQALVFRLRNLGFNVIGTTRRPAKFGHHRLNLAEPIDVDSIPRHISVAYLLASITSIAACEIDPMGTRFINVNQSLLLAEALHRSGTHVVIVSTNLVLDGQAPRARADAAYEPQNEYGTQKAELERSLLAAGKDVSVLRTTKIAESLTGLLQGWTKDLEQGRVIHPFSDLRCSPLPLAYIVDALVRLGNMRAEGLFQISADRDLSYLEIATVLADQFDGNASARVIGRTAAEMGVILPAKPSYTTLDSLPTESTLGLSPIFASDVVHALAKKIVASQPRN
jgi:dTDP-4-dehydrorhamnose reductase